MNGTKISISGESFVPLLTKIDECISYMEKNVSTLLYRLWEIMPSPFLCQILCNI